MSSVALRCNRRDRPRLSGAETEVGEQVRLPRRQPDDGDGPVGARMVQRRVVIRQLQAGMCRSSPWVARRWNDAACRKWVQRKILAGIMSVALENDPGAWFVGLDGFRRTLLQGKGKSWSCLR